MRSTCTFPSVRWHFPGFSFQLEQVKLMRRRRVAIKQVGAKRCTAKSVRDDDDSERRTESCKFQTSRAEVFVHCRRDSSLFASFIVLSKDFYSVLFSDICSCHRGILGAQSIVIVQVTLVSRFVMR